MWTFNQCRVCIAIKYTTRKKIYRKTFYKNEKSPIGFRRAWTHKILVQLCIPRTNLASNLIFSLLYYLAHAKKQQSQHTQENKLSY